MIRPDLMKAVLDALGSHRYLAREDFLVTEYTNKAGDPCLRATYRYEKDIFFQFHIPQKQTTKGRNDLEEAYRFSCSVRPGKEAVQEDFSATERSGMITELRAWIGRVYDDTVAAPLIRQFKEQAQAIDHLAERLNDLPDEPLSQEDIVAFKDGLERLRADVTNQLKDHEKDKEQLQGKVSELTADIEFLKQTLASLTKRQWGDLLATRVQKWKANFNLKQLAAGARVAKLLLPGSAGPVVDTVANAIDGIVAVVDAGSAKGEEEPEDS